MLHFLNIFAQFLKYQKIVILEHRLLERMPTIVFIPDGPYRTK